MRRSMHCWANKTQTLIQAGFRDAYMHLSYAPVPAVHRPLAMCCSCVLRHLNNIKYFGLKNQLLQWVQLMSTALESLQAFKKQMLCRKEKTIEKGGLL